jgi:creatinine amidohydrolase
MALRLQSHRRARAIGATVGGHIDVTINATDGVRRWEQLTWCEVAALRREVDMAILPVGSTEQHGPHLAMDTDTVSATVVAEAVAARTGVVVLPAIPYGCSLGHSHRWPGTLAVAPETLITLVVDVLSWAYAAGFRRLLILNGHVTNHAPLRCALEHLRARFDDCMVALRDVGDVSERVRAAYSADGADWHANCAETALMLAVAPDRVRADLLAGADDPDRTVGLLFSHPVNRTSTNGVTGMPSRATREAGTRLFEMVVEDLSAQVDAARRERPPLNASYFASVDGISPREVSDEP